MRLVWLSDLHLDFVKSEADIAALCDRVVETAPDIVLLGGDTGTAATLERYLLLLERHLRRPIYFVLGNHDFYGSSISKVRAMARDLCHRSKHLHWLSEAGLVELDAEVGLVGHDSWADGRLGAGFKSRMMLNDYLYIEDFRELFINARFAKLAALGDEAAAFFRQLLPDAFTRRRRIVLLTHVPPFREACWHQGRISNDEALPHFACGVVGDVLVEVMKERPDCHMTVLCGHTHSGGVAQILPNLIVHTASAEYGAARPQDQWPLHRLDSDGTL
jgi:3',5'-cyclic AMP phosphodiesterase CpdA